MKISFLKRHILILLSVSFIQKAYCGDSIVVDSTYKECRQYLDFNLKRNYNPEILTLDELFYQNSNFYSHNNKLNENIYTYKGLESRYYPVLLDGIPLYRAYNLLTDLSGYLSLPVSKGFLDENVCSYEYGPHVSNGEINLTTQEIDKGYFTNIDVLGSLFSGKAKASHMGTFKSLFWNVAGIYVTNNFYNLPEDVPENIFREDDTRTNSRSEILSFFTKIGIKGKTSSLYAMFLSNRRFSHIPPNIYTRKPLLLRNNDLFNNLASINYSIKASDHLILDGNFYFDYYNYELRAYDDLSFSSQIKDSSFTRTNDDWMLGGNLNLSYYHLLKEPLHAGIFYGNNYMKHRNINIIEKIVEAEDFSIYVKQNFSWGKYHPYAGSKFGFSKILTPDLGTLSKTITTKHIDAGLYYEALPNLNINLALSLKNRIPTIAEIANIDNAQAIKFSDLEHETIYNADLTVGYNILLVLKLSANIYWNTIQDYVFYNFDIFEHNSKNIEKAEVSGISFQADYINSFAEVKFNYAYNSTFGYEAGKRFHLPNSPKHISNLKASKSYNFGLSWSVEASYYSGIYAYWGTEQIKIQDYSLINLSIMQNIFENYNLYLRVSNILDEYYETEYGYPQPGRNIILGFNINFNT